ncbi:DUF6443 domain-containing protein [Chryseobacterium sp. RG1]|uniref:DUF6443 domain-containing protein n=1 Tax=Chryseobacterium tagetis TaxID=2801334 RepID=A0ABS8A8X4_9FLAO|nr:DUF6443 domain-containing protein [Chryseobacterium tagetis]MCA6069226.1 DUF6443 domain-containing protein [Chryseobacterium tagetis]
MKKIIIPISALLITGTAHAQLSTTENYIYSKIYLSDPTEPNVRTSETVQYFDGLGRPKQVVNIKASPLGRDIVTPVVYDGFGRQTRDYLPVPQQSTTNGAIYPQASGLVPYPVNDPSNIYNGDKIFTDKQLENSPLDRILSQKQVGNAWDGKPIQFGYDANIGGEVKKYTATFNYTTFEASITVSTSYAANQLYKNTVTDEDGNQTIEFKNGQGQVILVRKMLNASESTDTYYVYNDYDQLAYVLSPKAVDQIKNLSVGTPIPDTVLNNLCYQYKYDGRNRLVEKRLPGKGWEYMVYDKADRLVATQDANLRLGNKWLFNKYDKFGRVIYTGIAVDGGTREGVQGWILFTYGVNTEVSGSYTQSGLQIPYGNTAYPQNIESILTVNFYDTYPIGTPVFTPTIPNQSAVLTDNMSSDLNTKSLALASYVKNIEDDNWTKNYTYYDIRGRVIASHSINHLGGYTQTESKLDFTGLAQQTITRHKRLSSDTERVIDENFTYDLQNRLVKHTHKVDNNPQEEILAQNTYNEISQLTSKLVGGTNVGSGLQEVNYEYNIRGWMTKINDPVNLGNDLFGYEIRYTNPQYTNLASAKYNGNIAEVEWKTSKDGILKRYSYQYDALNRLNGGFYSEPDAFVPQNGYYNEAMSYDLNGNIMSLQRNSEVQNIGASQMDNLTYTYTGNQLNTVIDSSYNYSGYPGYGGNLINYDVNGNMIDHVDKGILEIKYNHLNLPNYVKFDLFVIRNDPFTGGTSTIYKNTKYVYRADGVKQSKIHNYFSGRIQGDSYVSTEYLDGFQYNYDFSGLAASLSPQGLQFVSTSEGYYDFAQNKYIYQYKDQVGNIRLSFYKDALGNTVIDRTNDYYPFGLEFGGSSSLNTYGSVSPNYTYSFQGQEKQQETGWNSFKWRNYDPAMGRFFNIDPLSEKYAYQSHYNFSENRVVDGRELEGLEWVKNSTINDNGTKTYTADAKFKVLNNAQNVISNSDLKYYFPRFTKQMEESYNGKTTSGDEFKVGKIEYQVVDKVDPSKDYYIELTTQVLEKDGSPSTAAGKVDKIGDTQVNRMQVNVKKTNLEGIVAHEVNHTAGNRHQDDPQNQIKDASTKIKYDNMMSSPIQSGNKLIPEQRDILLKNIPDEKKP